MSPYGNDTAATGWNAALGGVAYRGPPMDMVEDNYFTAARNCICVLAILANTGSIASLRHCKKPGPLHAKLLVSLAVSDLVIALVVLLKFILDEVTLRSVTSPHLAADLNTTNATLAAGMADDSSGQSLAESHAVYCVHLVLRSISVSAMNITLLNLLGMSIDHHIAVNRPLSYTRLMSPRRTGIMIAIFVLVGPLLGFSDMLLELGHTVLVVSGAVNDPRFTENMFCDRVDITPYHEEYAVIVITMVCLVVMTAVYINICLAVRRLSNRARMRRSTISADTETRDSCTSQVVTATGTSVTTTVTMATSRARQAKSAIRGRSNKAIATTALLLVAFAVCWLPLETFQIYMMVNVHRLKDYTLAHKVEGHLLNLTLLNTVIDPFIYALRMHEVRVGYRRLWLRIQRVATARKASLSYAWKSVFGGDTGPTGGGVRGGAGGGAGGGVRGGGRKQQRRYFKNRAGLNNGEGAGARRDEGEHMELMKKNSVLSNDASTVMLNIREETTICNS